MANKDLLTCAKCGKKEYEGYGGKRVNEFICWGCNTKKCPKFTAEEIQNILHDVYFCEEFGMTDKKTIRKLKQYLNIYVTKQAAIEAWNQEEK